MPHSLYLGSGIVQARLHEYDSKNGLLPEAPEPDVVASTEPSPQAGVASNTTRDVYDDNDPSSSNLRYVPSIAAVQYSLKYSIAELALALFTFALFVNSAILIVAGASLYGNPEVETADIFAIHELLSASISKAAGTIFALALLLSGISAGIVCTIAGQMVSEGQLNWRLKPWLRRLVTRLISIIPSIVVAAAVGREGLDKALNASQVALSIALPFVTAPLIYFTCRARYMTVLPGKARLRDRNYAAKRRAGDMADGGVAAVRDEVDPGSSTEGDTDAQEGSQPLKMANSWYVAGCAVLVWVVIAAMNIANLVLLGIGE